MPLPATLSVLLPVYNGAAYVEATIQSILEQSYRTYELIVLDDGSTDQTPQILERYVRSDPRLRVLRHANHGVGYTLQRGLVESKGRFVALIGADDLALPGRLEKQVAFLDANRDHVFIGGYLRIIDAHGRAIGLRRYPSTDERLRRAMLLYNPFGAPSAMFRRDDALAAGGFTSRFWTCEDYDFFLRLARRGKMANLPEPLVAYRLHENAVKATHTLRQLRDTLATKRAAYDEYGYRPSLLARTADFAMEIMTHLPPAMTYRIFTAIAIRAKR